MRKILPLFVLLMTTAAATANATGYTENFTYATSFGTNVFADANSFEQTTNKYHSEAYVEYDNEHADINGGVDIELTEYEKGKFSVTFKRFTTGFSIYGDLTIDNLTATTSDKGTTYNITDASKAVWKSITPAGIMSGLSENGEATFSNFTCTIDSDNNIFLSYNVDLAGSDVKVVVGKAQSVTNNYHSEAYVEYDNEHADINDGVDIELTEYEQGKFSVTFKRFTTGFTIYGDLTINNLTATTSDKGTTYNITDASKAVWKSITPAGIMSGLSENGEATFSNFKCTIDNDNNIFLSYNVDLAGSDVKVVVGKAQPVTSSYNGELVVKDSLTAETLLEQKDAQTEITINADSTASLTMKNVTLGKVSGDITFTGTYVVAEEDGENVFTLQGVSDETTTALFGAELKCTVKGTYPKEDEASYTFEMFNETKSVHYVGMFAKNAIATGINNISAATSATNAQIFNVSGVKVSGLQKGINIVRTADGKTVKVLCK